MKVAQLIQYGGLEAIKINEVEMPQVQDESLLVEVHAAGVNPFDWKIQNGYMKDFIPLNLPITLGGDFSGVVLEVGKAVVEFKKGDEVYGQANVLAGGSGSFAQNLLTKPSLVAKKPTKLNFIEAGSLPLVGSSVIQALQEHIKLEKGQKILIHGGAGGIGSIAIQIAKQIGAHVATTVSADDLDYVKKLGADEIINYKTQKFDEILKDFDAVFDTVGGDTTNRSLTVLKNGGIIVSMGQPADEQMAKEKNISVIAQMSKVSTQSLNQLSELIDKGFITVNVEKTFSLDEAALALDYLKNSPPQGKVVIAIK
jgi:NADPH:quinone reductase-like Zn-dependent oxidoreductase